MKKNFRSIAKTTLILVYCVIIAGAMVRMTGSGMGCPDWPKCFGYYIPPTQQEQLMFQPGREFEKGQVIIQNEALYVAAHDFKSGENFNPVDWNLYTKHDYAIFNPTHTWIEYLNRLMGAVAGIATLVMAFASFRFWKKRKSIVLLSWLTVFLMGFQGWLGATVVYSVLNPVRITLHMVVALLIVAIILLIIYKVARKSPERHSDTLFGSLLGFSLVLSGVQIVLGTQVRQFVDERVKQAGAISSNDLLNDPSTSFLIHRSFSIIVVLLAAYLCYRNRKLELGYMKLDAVMALLIAEIISGIAMAYFDFPFGSQAIHLVFATILFGIQFYIILEYRHKKKKFAL